MLKQFKRCAGRRFETAHLHQKEIEMPVTISVDSDNEEPDSTKSYKADV